MTELLSEISKVVEHEYFNYYASLKGQMKSLQTVAKIFRQCSCPKILIKMSTECPSVIKGCFSIWLITRCYYNFGD